MITTIVLFFVIGELLLEFVRVTLGLRVLKKLDGIENRLQQFATSTTIDDPTKLLLENKLHELQVGQFGAPLGRVKR